MTPQELKAIRRRAKHQPTLGLVAQHNQAVADRAALLEYIDALSEQIKGVGQSVSEILGMVRLQLAAKLVTDGHAATFREGIAIASDLTRVATIYPDFAP